jgi:pimeloyl-ACP methyl ester carboxylesterase
MSEWSGWAFGVPFEYGRPVRLNHHRGGSGPPLLLIHGIGSRWQVWEPVLGRVAAEREVVAVDLPGFAGSPPPPPGTQPGIESLTRFLVEFLDEIGLERPHVGGNSLGGWLALELAKHGRARSATALSPAGFHSRAEAVYQRGSLWLSHHAARWLAPRARAIAASRVRRAAALGQFVAHPERLPEADTVQSLRALAGAAWFDETLTAITADRFRGGEQIQVPVTVAWAQRDRVLLPRQAPRAQQAIPRARLITLRDCGHVPTYDDPEQVAAVLLEGSRE